MSDLIDLTRDHVAHSPRGERFAKYVADLSALCASPESAPKEVGDDFRELNARLRRRAERALARGETMTPEMVVKELSIGDVQSSRVLNDLAIMYQNDEYIGTRLLPPVPVPTGTMSQTYWTLNKETSFQYPDDSISTGGSASQVDIGMTETSATLVPHALQANVDARVKAAMDAPVAALVNPLMIVLDGLALRQESRIATVATTSGNYGSNTGAISSGDRWNTADGGDPAGAVDAAKAALYRGEAPALTVGFTSLAVYNVLRRHPAIVDQFKYTGRDVVGRSQLAQYFELDDLLVGNAKYNASLRGGTASYTSLWGKSFGVLRVLRAPALKAACFGITIEEPKVETEWFEAAAGGWGSFISKVAFADTSVVVCSDCGYLLTTVID